MRCSSRDGPWGSHQLEASALKCDTSVGSTEPWPLFGTEVVEKKRELVDAAEGRCVAERELCLKLQSLVRTSLG